MDNVNQLADLIMALIQDKVDERIEQRISDMSDSVISAFDIQDYREGIVEIIDEERSFFDIQDYRDDIVGMIDEDLDISDKVQEALSETTFSVTVD